MFRGGETFEQCRVCGRWRRTSKWGISPVTVSMGEPCTCSWTRRVIYETISFFKSPYGWVVVVSIIALVLGLISLGLKWWTSGPFPTISTNSPSWSMMQTEEEVGLNFPVLYDAYFNSLSIEMGTQKQSARWIEVVVFSRSEICKVWSPAEVERDLTALNIGTDGGSIRGIYASVGESGPGAGGEYWTLRLPDNLKDPFTVYAEKEKGITYSVTINPADIVDLTAE